MIFERFEVPGLSQYSYAVGVGGSVAIIDPKRDVDTYLDYARSRDLRIKYVLETHIHADFSSGGRALASQTGAELCLSGYTEGEVFSYHFCSSAVARRRRAAARGTYSRSLTYSRSHARTHQLPAFGIF